MEGGRLLEIHDYGDNVSLVTIMFMPDAIYCHLVFAEIFQHKSFLDLTLVPSPTYLSDQKEDKIHIVEISTTSKAKLYLKIEIKIEYYAQNGVIEIAY